jgi:hypothetical protein
MRLSLALGPAALLAALAVLAACFEVQQACAQEPGLVVEIPWSDGERAEYVLLESEGGEECGSGALTVSRRGDQFELSLRFEDDEGNSDESAVLVDAGTLKPASVRRERVIDGETEAIEGAYDAEAEVLTITELSDGDDRTVPLRLEGDYYDNESSLFLWRTIDFADGYEASYRAVIAAQNTQHTVNLFVRGKEQVTVPAGTFECWRLEIEASGRRQTAWFADTPERPLVKYDNSFQVFELTSYEPGG